MFTLYYKFKNNESGTSIEFSDMEGVKEFLDEDLNISDISDIDEDVLRIKGIDEFVLLDGDVEVLYY